MIGKQDVLERAREWSLRPEVVEKDHVLGWLLAALGSHPVTGTTWIFKGGTCLKKCYFETYRFSEDLDFSMTDAGDRDEGEIGELLAAVTASAAEASGIEFPPELVSVRRRRDRLGRRTFQGRVSYRGALARRRDLQRVSFDLTVHEPILDAVTPRAIFHPYPDELPSEAEVACYSLPELLAEKLRALVERTRPRDLYDVVFVLDNRVEALDLRAVRRLFRGKCEAKGFEPPGAAAILDRVKDTTELVSEWENMLAHQLPALLPSSAMMERLGPLLAFLEKEPLPPAPPQVPSRGRRGARFAPSGLTFLGGGPGLELLRFAGSNRACVEFEYHGRHRVVEPYSLRRPDTGSLLLYARELGSEAPIKAFKLDEIEHLRATQRTFVPRYQVELTATGPLAAPRPSRGSAGPPRRPSGRGRHRRARLPGPRFVYECVSCGRAFRHSKPGGRLRPHQRPGGAGPCPGRRGVLVRSER